MMDCQYGSLYGQENQVHNGNQELSKADNLPRMNTEVGEDTGLSQNHLGLSEIERSPSIIENSGDLQPQRTVDITEAHLQTQLGDTKMQNKFKDICDGFKDIRDGIKDIRDGLFQKMSNASATFTNKTDPFDSRCYAYPAGVPPMLDQKDEYCSQMEEMSVTQGSLSNMDDADSYQNNIVLGINSVDSDNVGLATRIHEGNSQFRGFFSIAGMYCDPEWIAETSHPSGVVGIHGMPSDCPAPQGSGYYTLVAQESTSQELEPLSDQQLHVMAGKTYSLQEEEENLVICREIWYSPQGSIVPEGRVDLPRAVLSEVELMSGMSQADPSTLTNSLSSLNGKHFLLVSVFKYSY